MTFCGMKTMNGELKFYIVKSHVTAAVHNALEKYFGADVIR